MAYARAVKRFFDWCDDHHLGLNDIEPIAIAAYIEELGSEIAQPSVKQHLAAIRQLFTFDDLREPGTSEKMTHENTMPAALSSIRVHRTHKTIGKSAACIVGILPLACILHQSA
jgi:site-specific recombinase XerD